MSFFSIENIEVKGISAAVPFHCEDNETLNIMSANDRRTFIESTGIRYRHIAPEGLTASDLCIAAASNLLSKMGWAASDIDVLIFVSQTGDYIMPCTAAVIHHRMGLATKCLALDINLGCSGYVYGLSVISALMQNMPGAKGLLLAGDCSSAVISKNDKSTFPLFGDAGSATSLEHTGSGITSHFTHHTDGSGFQDIMIHDGGQRHPFSSASLKYETISTGIERNQLQMKLDGINIFNFALREVAPDIQQVIKQAGLDQSLIDYFVLHQANKLILECIRKKLKEPEYKFPYSLYKYGNTSSASIPVTIAAELSEQLPGRTSRLLLSGFGVGLSWGSAYITVSDPVILPIIRV